MLTFLLMDFGISENCIKRLYDYGITTIEQIEEKDSCLVVSFGKNSIKSRQIVNAINKIKKIDYKNEIFSLFKYGLRMQIIRRIEWRDIKFEELRRAIISKSLRKKYDFSDYESKSITAAYELYAKDINDFEILLEYGLSKTIIEKIKDLNITYEILENENLKEILKEKYLLKNSTIEKIIDSYINFSENLKKEKIYLIDVNNSIEDEINKNNLNILLNFGIVDKTLDKLKKQNFLLRDLFCENSRKIINEKYDLSEASVERLENAKIHLLRINNIIEDKIKDFSGVVYKCLKGIKRELICKDEFLQKLKKEYKCNLSNQELNYALDVLEKEEKIKVINNNILVKYISLRDRVENVLEEKWKNIFWDRINGETLETIGKKYKYTRERIRQIIKESLKKIHYVREDLYANVYKNYNCGEETFCKIFNERIETYNYLKLKYTKGTKELSGLLNDEFLSDIQKEELRKILNII